MSGFSKPLYPQHKEDQIFWGSDLIRPSSKDNSKRCSSLGPLASCLQFLLGGCWELNDAEQWLCLLLHTYLIVPLITMEKHRQHTKVPGRYGTLRRVRTSQWCAPSVPGCAELLGDKWNPSRESIRLSSCPPWGWVTVVLGAFLVTVVACGAWRQGRCL